MTTITELGYRSADATQKLEFGMREHPNAILVDIRFSPSGKSGWSQRELRAKWGKRYLHIPELGNRNYKQHGNIQIVDLERGVERLVDGLHKGFDIILLCACENFETCHRKVVLEATIKCLKLEQQQ